MAHTDTRTGLVSPDLTDAPPDITTVVAGLVPRLSQVMAMYDQGARASRDSPGKPGRLYRVSDEGRTIAGVQQGRFTFDTGANWVNLEEYIPVVDSLPGSANDGDRIYLRFFDPYAGGPDGYYRYWHLIYVADAPARKWRVLGGQPITFSGNPDSFTVVNRDVVQAYFNNAILFPVAGRYQLDLNLRRFQMGTGGSPPFSASGSLGWQVVDVVAGQRLSFGESYRTVQLHQINGVYYDGVGLSSIEYFTALGSGSCAIYGVISGASSMTVDRVRARLTPLELGT